jgi:glycine/D-amino acid oxidase-like deaminating enzyme
MAGLQTSYYLAERDVKVTLIDIGEGPATVTSYQNGCMFPTLSSNPWTIKPLSEVMRGLWSDKVVQKVYLSWNLLTDLSYYKFFYYWMMLNKDDS